MARLGGGDVLVGALAAGGNEALLPTAISVGRDIGLSDEEVRAILPSVSAALGGALGAVTTGSSTAALSGADVAATATLFNYLKHDEVASLRKEIARCADDSCRNSVVEKYRLLSNHNDSALASCKTVECVSEHTAAIAVAASEVAALRSDDRDGLTAMTVSTWQRRALTVAIPLQTQRIVRWQQEAKELAIWQQKNCVSLAADACAAKLKADREASGKLALLLAMLLPGVGAADDLKVLFTGADIGGEEASRVVAAISIAAGGYPRRVMAASDMLRSADHAADLANARRLSDAEQALFARTPILTQREALNLQGEHKGMIFVLETPRGSIAAQSFQAGTAGAFGSVKHSIEAVPALRFNNPRGDNFIRGDGWQVLPDGTVSVIDRKLSLPMWHESIARDKLQDFRRVKLALDQNPGFSWVLEFPNESTRRSAQLFLNQNDITWIATQISRR